MKFRNRSQGTDGDSKSQAPQNNQRRDSSDESDYESDDELLELARKIGSAVENELEKSHKSPVTENDRPLFVIDRTVGQSTETVIESESKSDNDSEKSKESDKEESDKEESDKEEKSKEEKSKEEKSKEEKSKEESDKEEYDKEESDKEEYDKEESDKEEYDKEESDKEEYDKEESDKEESDKEESDKEESDKEESDKEESSESEDETYWRTRRKTLKIKKALKRVSLSSSLQIGTNLGDVYINTDPDNPSASFKSTKSLLDAKSKIDEVLSRSVITPDYEKKHQIPTYQESLHQIKKKRREERSQTKGKNWFGMKAPEMTEEKKNDLMVLQWRRALDPKHFFKASDTKAAPKFFQMGKVVEDHTDFFSARVPKKQRKANLVEELLADAEFRNHNKKKYAEILESKKQGKGAYRHMNRQKRQKRQKKRK